MSQQELMGGQWIGVVGHMQATVQAPLLVCVLQYRACDRSSYSFVYE